MARVVCTCVQLVHPGAHPCIARGSAQNSVRGYDKVEEYDPMERMKRLATGPAVSSLEQELKHMQETVNIKDFEYKPVPRTDDHDE